jgi:hypothetical protein
MGRLFRLFFLLIIAAAVVGFCRDWFSISTSSDESTTHVNTTINREKVREDMDQVMSKVQSEWRQHVEGRVED